MSVTTDWLSAEDLETITTAELAGIRLVKLKPGVEMTAEFLAKLRAVVDCQALVPGLDISALDAKLRNLSPRTSRSVTPVITNDMVQADVVAARDRLLALGGRPLRPLNFDPAPWDPSMTIREEHHIQKHRNQQSDTCKPELERWEAFRAAQNVARADALKFSEHERSVRKYRIKHGFKGPIRLHLEPEQQTALNEWKEYQVFQHCQLVIRERDVQQARHKLKTVEKALKGHLEGGDSELVILVTDVDRAEATLRSWKDYLEWIEQQRSVIDAEESSTQRNTSRHSGRKRITQKSSLSTVVRRKISKRLGDGKSRVARRNSDATANAKGLGRQGRESRTALAPRRSKRIAEITDVRNSVAR